MANTQASRPQWPFLWRHTGCRRKRQRALVWWAHKPGSHDFGKPKTHTGKIETAWKEAVKEGADRLAAFRKMLIAQIAAGRVGVAIGSAKGACSEQACLHFVP